MAMACTQPIVVLCHTSNVAIYPCLSTAANAKKNKLFRHAVPPSSIIHGVFCGKPVANEFGHAMAVVKDQRQLLNSKLVVGHIVLLRAFMTNLDIATIVLPKSLSYPLVSAITGLGPAPTCPLFQLIPSLGPKVRLPNFHRLIFSKR